MPVRRERLTDPDTGHVQDQDGLEIAMKPESMPFDGDTLQALEAELRRHIGLRAGIALRRALRTVSDRTVLMRELARQIGDPSQRADFMLHAGAVLGVRSAVEPWRWLNSSSTLATIERHLSQRLGPLAAVLVRQAAGRNRVMRVVIDELAEAVDGPAERAQFIFDLVADLRRERRAA